MVTAIDLELGGNVELRSADSQNVGVYSGTEPHSDGSIQVQVRRHRTVLGQQHETRWAWWHGTTIKGHVHQDPGMPSSVEGYTQISSSPPDYQQAG